MLLIQMVSISNPHKGDSSFPMSGTESGDGNVMASESIRNRFCGCPVPVESHALSLLSLFVTSFASWKQATHIQLGYFWHYFLLCMLQEFISAIYVLLFCKTTFKNIYIYMHVNFSITTGHIFVFRFYRTH